MGARIARARRSLPGFPSGSPGALRGRGALVSVSKLRCGRAEISMNCVGRMGGDAFGAAISSSSAS